MIGPSLSRVILLKDSISIITSINVLAPTWLNDGDMPKDTKSGTMKGIVTISSIPSPISAGGTMGTYEHLPFGLGAATLPQPISLAAGDSIAATSQVGAAIGKELASIGVNWIFTPTLDLLSDVTEPLSASQTFGSNPTTATNHALALIQGLAAEGVTACSNAHPPMAVLEIFRSQEYTGFADDVNEQSDTPEFLPIANAIARYPYNSMQFGAGIHEFPEPVQSAGSIRAACGLILRNKCRYKGPTVSSLTDTPEDAGVCARHAPLVTILAGLDIFRLPEDPVAQRESITILKAAMASNDLPLAWVSEAAARVARLKAQSLTWERALQQHQPASSLTTAPDPLAEQTYRASITAISSSSSPLLGLAPNSLLILLTPTVPRRHPNSPSDPFEPLGQALARSFPRTRHVPYTLSAGLLGDHRSFLQRAAAVVFVLCNTSSAMIESQDEVIRKVQLELRARDAKPNQPRTRKVVMSAGDPRDLRDDFEGWWTVCCYEYSRGALEAAAEVVLGERQATGRLPV
ncbi:MAG: hypothetical protein L6R40_006276 [Gallowayella cf. fulva]|nr:MAG: hypothetical protein L6R40_006276 [Xanthomendoza cf. fulva]